MCEFANNAISDDRVCANHYISALISLGSISLFGIDQIYTTITTDDRRENHESLGARASSFVWRSDLAVYFDPLYLSKPFSFGLYTHSRALIATS